MLVSDFDYELPPELIAQIPAGERDASKLMVFDRARPGVSHKKFTDLPGYLRPGDALVINDTRVFPARLTGTKDTGGAVEALLLRNLGGGVYEALVKGRVPPGGMVTFGGEAEAAVLEDMGGGRKVLKFAAGEAADDLIERVGRMPLPPYIKDSGRDEARDRERYQTVYAARSGAVAAPTAGLHFTPALMDRIKDMGVTVAPVTLHVGVGTFSPVRVEEVERHGMDEEEYEVPEATADAIKDARAGGGRVIAVGTTSARTIESAADAEGIVRPGSGRTRLFIYPGYRFTAVDALVTNFHLPKSTLLMLVCALAGRERVLSAYADAVRGKYRFYSYGDAMLVL